MVLTYSVRIPRVPTYSGYCSPLHLFAYGPLTLSRITFQISSAKLFSANCSPSPRAYCYTRFGLLRFRSPLLSESFVYFLFLRVIRWFSSPGSPHIPMDSVYDTATLLAVSFLIRTSTGQRSFATYRSFSQLVTSFFGAMYQGILLCALCSLFFLKALFRASSNYLPYKNSFWLSVIFIRFLRINLCDHFDRVVFLLPFCTLFSLIDRFVSALSVFPFYKKNQDALYKPLSRLYYAVVNLQLRATARFSGSVEPWWAQMDSNHRPRAYQARALTSWAMSPFILIRNSQFAIKINIIISIIAKRFDTAFRVNDRFWWR